MTRALVVHLDSATADMAAAALGACGYVVERCVGPELLACPVLSGHGCPRAERADVLVYDLAALRHEEDYREVGGELRALYADKPMVVVAGGPELGAPRGDRADRRRRLAARPGDRGAPGAARRGRAESTDGSGRSGTAREAGRPEARGVPRPIGRPYPWPMRPPTAGRSTPGSTSSTTARSAPAPPRSSPSSWPGATGWRPSRWRFLARELEAPARRGAGGAWRVRRCRRRRPGPRGQRDRRDRDRPALAPLRAGRRAPRDRPRVQRRPECPPLRGGPRRRRRSGRPAPVPGRRPRGGRAT